MPKAGFLMTGLKGEFSVIIYFMKGCYFVFVAFILQNFTDMIPSNKYLVFCIILDFFLSYKSVFLSPWF